MKFISDYKFDSFMLSNENIMKLKNRIQYRDCVRECLKVKDYVNLFLPFESVMDELNMMDIIFENNIGNGSWGEVYKTITHDGNYNVAIKISKLDKKDKKLILQNKFNKNEVKWHENYLFKHIINNNPHPNLPLYIDSIVSPEYTFKNLRKQAIDTSPAMVTCIELGHTDLQKYMMSIDKMNKGTFLSIFFKSVLPFIKCKCVHKT